MHLIEHPLKTSFIDAAQSVTSWKEPVEDLLAEYIVEAERGEGADYWNQFETVSDAVEDFERFVSFCEEAEEVFEL